MQKLSEAAKEARREYQRKRYAANPERQKENMRRYWERKAEKAQQEKETVNA